MVSVPSVVQWFEEVQLPEVLKISNPHVVKVWCGSKGL